MCGIAGFLDCKLSIHPSSWEETLRKMGEVLSHRGYDDSGIWFDIKAGVGFSHRRLSILDISSAGHQPMISNSGRYVITFNGEIYNHLDLRKKLTSIDWRGSSDTETLLAAIDSWGLNKVLELSVGMFALAVWDRELRVLQLARDRMGEKPLYYGWQGEVFLFASELKAIKCHPSCQSVIDRNSLNEYMSLSYIPAPLSIYKGIKKLLPGTIIEVSVKNEYSCTVDSYWNLKDVAERGEKQNYLGSDFEVINRTEELLRQSVKSQLISDVPLGAFLSGGIDSSLVVALMQQESSSPIKTFTIGFNEGQFNEAKYAKLVAKHFGTEHTEEYINSKDALDVISELPFIYDEPFADSSQIPTYLLSKVTRKSVTVSLSGDGADELFGGYLQYKLIPRINTLPKALRVLLSKLLLPLNNSYIQNITDSYALKFLFKLELKNIPYRAKKFSLILASSGIEQMYENFIREYISGNLLIEKQYEHNFETIDFLKQIEHKIMYIDTKRYLPDDIMVKVDRASMSSTLESRAPFLDHRLVEFAWSLPMSMKIRNGRGKWVLRQILSKYIPNHLIDRPKMGFAVPIAEWLRGPLRPWAEELLDPRRMKQEGFFNHKLVQDIWRQHLKKEYNWKTQLWTILMFQQWMNSIKNNR